jgi:hypothetical protein
MSDLKNSMAKSIRQCRQRFFFCIIKCSVDFPYTNIYTGQQFAAAVRRRREHFTRRRSSNHHGHSQQNSSLPVIVVIIIRPSVCALEGWNSMKHSRITTIILLFQNFSFEIED